jgi:hypothetical protein
VAGDRQRLERLRQELLWRKAKSNESFALRTFYSIKVPGVGRMLFDLRDAQEQAISVWDRDRYNLTLKARQIGWSTVVTGHCWWLTFFNSDREVLLISRGEREAGELLAKIKYAMQFLPEWMLARGPQVTSDSKQRIDFSNGSSIISLPSASNPARGFAGYLVVVDEWAFLNNPEEAWSAIEPVADVGGRIIGLSTANGWGNFFHNLWVGAETGVNQFSTMFHSWRAGGRDDAWYETKKRTLPAWQLAQEYPDNPEEAFLKSGNPVFDLEKLHAMGAHILTPKVGMLVEVPV